MIAPDDCNDDDRNLEALMCWERLQEQQCQVEVTHLTALLQTATILHMYDVLPSSMGCPHG